MKNSVFTCRSYYCCSVNKQKGNWIFCFLNINLHYFSVIVVKIRKKYVLFTVVVFINILKKQIIN